MLACHQDPDYKNQFCEHPELTKIHNEPETQSLIIIRNEIKANAMTVHTTLGGGASGHLGLVLIPAQYEQVPNSVEYQKPEHPGALEIPNPGTQYQIAALRDQHHEDIRLFCEVTSVELALIQQIVAAIEPKYLRALRNGITNRIEKKLLQKFSLIYSTLMDIRMYYLEEK